MQKLVFILAVCSLSVSCKDKNKVEPALDKDTVTVKTTDSSTQKTNTTAAATLVVTPQDISGDQGQITFTEKEKTVFYYDLKTKKGKIVLNGTEHILDKYTFNKDTYAFTGDQLTITAPNSKYKKNEGSDCNYGTIPTVTVTLATATVVLNNIDVQDCPAY